MTKRTSVEETLRKSPLITHGALARVKQVGDGTVQSAVRRLGLGGERLVNGRYLLSFDEAVAVAEALEARRG